MSKNSFFPILVNLDERDLIQLEQGIDHGNDSIFVTIWL
jgi:hypothetical protein